jgi:hypothetical protein
MTKILVMKSLEGSHFIKKGLSIHLVAFGISPFLFCLSIQRVIVSKRNNNIID